MADPYADHVDGGRYSAELAGARLGDLIEDTARGRVRAVAVGPVAKDSPAWNVGLREGDVLLELNRERVLNLKELELGLSKSRGLFSLRIQRGERLITLSRR